MRTCSWLKFSSRSMEDIPRNFFFYIQLYWDSRIDGIFACSDVMAKSVIKSSNYNWNKKDAFPLLSCTTYVVRNNRQISYTTWLLFANDWAFNWVIHLARCLYFTVSKYNGNISILTIGGIYVAIDYPQGCEAFSFSLCIAFVLSVGFRNHCPFYVV
jgi:hypothetical protein